MSEFPQKEFYRLNEVCQYTDTQPYVLRFWESEFPQLGPGGAQEGRRLYRKADIDLVRRIKQLLYEEECTIDEARQRIEREQRAGHVSRAALATPGAAAPERAGRVAERPSREVAAQRIASALPPREIPPPEPAAQPDLIPRKRYDDAVEEIEHLRLLLKEAERQRRKAEAALEEATASLARSQERAAGAIERLERVLGDLT